jgi:hypothetical protein
MYLTRQPTLQQGPPCGGHGTQHGGIQNERASNPVIVPGPIDIGRSGPPHCVVLLEFAVEVIARRGDLLLEQSLFLREYLRASLTYSRFEAHGIGLRQSLITESG